MTKKPNKQSIFKHILVNVVMSKEEKKKIQELAKKEHRSVSAYLRLRGLKDI